MTRKKLNLTYISDATLRKTTFKHRKRGLMKKLDELKTLCDVDACAVINNPSNSNLEVWPSNLGVTNVIEKFEMLSETEKLHRSVNHEGFLKQNIAKVEKQNKRLMEENKENYMKELMLGCLGGNMEKLSMDDNARRELCNFIDRYLMDLIHHKNVTLNNPHFEVGESSSMAMAADMAPTSMVAVMAPSAMAETGFSSFLNAPIFNSPQLTDELQPISQPTNKFQSIINSNHLSEHVNILASKFLNSPIINSPQPTNELQSIISSNQSPEHVNSFASDFQNAPIFHYPQPTNELQPIISSNQGPEHVNVLASNLLPNSDQEVYIPVMSSKDEFYYSHQNQNQYQPQQFLEEMMKLGEQTCFPWMENNHQF